MSGDGPPLKLGRLVVTEKQGLAAQPHNAEWFEEVMAILENKNFIVDNDWMF